MSLGLGMQSLILDLGFKVKVRVHSDACAAIGIARRRGLGRVRHLHVEDLWVQSKVREGHVDLVKGVPTTRRISSQSMYRLTCWTKG